MNAHKNGLEHNERGTTVWHLNCLRSDLLPNLLDDLVSAERTGLIEGHCKEVKRALDKVVNSATSIPDGSFWTRSIWKELEGFKEIYDNWNSMFGDHHTAQQHRRTALKKLRKQRHCIAKKIRKHQHILANELDLKLITASHEAMADLVKAVPDLFKELGKAVNRYAEKQAGL